MFGHDSLPSRIYRYGAKAPTVGAENVDRQMSLGHRYYNTLVEIERRRREKAAALVARVSPALASLEQRREALTAAIAERREAVKKSNQEVRKKQATKDERDAIAALTAERKEVNVLYRDAKDLAYNSPEAAAGLAAIDQQADMEAKTARAESGLYWGTYLQVEQSLPRKGPPPKFHRWMGDGKIAVQIQGGMTLEEAFAGRDQRFRLEPIPDNAWDKGNRKHRRTRAWIRVASDGRDPVWAVVPVVLHRPIPDDAQIKWVYLLRRRVGCNNNWSLCLVISRQAWQRHDLAGDGAVGINLGWRKVEGGIRVATWVGDDDESGTLVISERDAGRWQKAKDLRSRRDGRFNAIQEALVDWLGSHAVPEWFSERTATIKQWRSQARLAALVIAWRSQRFEGDEGIFPAMEAWRKKDKHLYEWEANQRRKAVAWRNDLYRCFAAKLSQRYETAVLGKTDWKTIGRRPSPENPEHASGGENRTLASPGILQRMIVERVARVELADAKHITQRCHACGKLASFDARTNIFTTCRHCAETWDQDENAARNLLLSASGPVAQKTP